MKKSTVLKIVAGIILYLYVLSVWNWNSTDSHEKVDVSNTPVESEEIETGEVYSSQTDRVESLLERFSSYLWQLKFADNPYLDLVLDEKLSKPNMVVLRLVKDYKNKVRNKTTLNEWVFVLEEDPESEMILMQMVVNTYGEINEELPKSFLAIEKLIVKQYQQKVLLNEYIGVGYETSVSGNLAWCIEYRHKKSGSAGEVYIHSDKAGTLSIVRSQKLKYNKL